MSTLPSTRNNVTTERRVRSAARQRGMVNTRTASTFYEHGQWWVENARTGAQWAVVDTLNGFDFEQITKGDEL